MLFKLCPLGRLLVEVGGVVTGGGVGLIGVVPISLSFSFRQECSGCRLRRRIPPAATFRWNRPQRSLKHSNFPACVWDKMTLLRAAVTRGIIRKGEALHEIHAVEPQALLLQRV